MKNILTTILISFFLVACMSNNQFQNKANQNVKEVPSPNAIANNPVGHVGLEDVSPYVFFQTDSILNENVFQQIWRVQVDGPQQELLFEQSSVSDKPISDIFSTSELAAFEDWYSFEGVGVYPPANEIYPFINIKRITLSPKGQHLAWIETISWGPPNSTLGFAMIRLVVLDVIKKEKNILYEVARHPNRSISGGTWGLHDLVWSLEGQQLILMEGPLTRRDYQTKLVNIDTKKIEDLGLPGEGGIFPNWSPNKALLVIAKVDVTEMITLKTLSMTDPILQKDLIGSWGVINGVDWSPSDKMIIFAASKATFSENLKLYAVNVDTRNLVDLSLDKKLSYSYPQWSPDGKLIGMNAAPTSIGSVDRLLIYDVSRQEVIARLEGERSNGDWYWSDDSQSILLTRGSPPHTPQTVELFYWQENRTEIVPFPESIEDGVAIGISSE